jgi:chaperonin GroES
VYVVYSIYKRRLPIMNVPVKPLKDRIVAIKEEPQTKTASGLYLPDAAKEKPAEATVVAVGKDVAEVKIGDKIIFKEDYPGPTRVKIDKQEYLIVSEEDVLATVA